MTLSRHMDFSKYIGIPYRDPGSTGEGLHCYELVERVMSEVYHMEPPDAYFTGHYKDSAPVFMNKLLYWMAVPFKQRQPGDMLVLKIAGAPVHCGIIVNELLMLHTLKGRDSCLESYLSANWTRRIYGVYRWLG